MTAITMIATMTQISQDGMGTPSRVGRPAVPPVIRRKRQTRNPFYFWRVEHSDRPP
jgi:hypothetical protein